MLLFILGFIAGFILNLITSYIVSKRSCRQCIYTEMFETELEGVLEAISE